MRDRVDVLIIGSGPAGLAAAEELARYRLDVCLLDEQLGAGGQIWRNTMPAPEWPGVQFNPSSTVVDVDVDESVSVTWLQTSIAGRVLRNTQARALIIATGAMERPVLFPGAQLPGVMGVGAVQGVFKQSGLVPRGHGVILAGHGPLLLLTAEQILSHGGSIDAVLELSRPGALANAIRRCPSALISDRGLLHQGLQLLIKFRQSGIRVLKKVTALQACGSDQLEQVQFVSEGRSHTLPARLLAVHDGVFPNTQLTRLLNLEHHWNEAQQSFAPVTRADGLSSHACVWIAGDGAGIAGVDLAVKRGKLTGISVAQTLEPTLSRQVAFDPLAAMTQLKNDIRRRLPARHFVDALYPALPVEHFATPDTIVCRCEAIRLSAVHSAIASGAIGPNRVKTFTRCGMGACQGRQCSTPLTRIIADATGRSAEKVGALRIRPPLKPTLIGDYLSLHASELDHSDANA
jgi:thioredoxin reductase